MGAYAKSGSAPIVGMIKPGDIPPTGGLYLMDVVPDGEVRFGFPNITDNAEIVEMAASGAHMTLFVTGRGSVVGNAVSPVIKICANPETYRRLADDMDINAGKVLEGAPLAEIGDEIYDLVLQVASGAQTKSEELGHAEFVLTYKSFEPLGPACPPEGCIHHTDRGSQYCSHDYQKILRQHGFQPSMSGKGNCYDNAAVETFFKTIKAELLWQRSWETRRTAELAIFEYINGFYNPRRRHSALGWKSPLAFERKAAQVSYWCGIKP